MRIHNDFTRFDHGQFNEFIKIRITVIKWLHLWGLTHPNLEVAQLYKINHKKALK